MSGFFKVFDNESFFCGVSGRGGDFTAEVGHLIDEHDAAVMGDTHKTGV